MKLRFFSASALLAMVCASQASMINISGIFENTESFVWDGKTFENNWAIQFYETSTMAVDFTLTKTAIGSTKVMITGGWTIISPQSNVEFSDNQYMYSVLFDNVSSGAAGNYLLLDTVARNVGAYNSPTPAADYTPGADIPNTGYVAFGDQTWQPIPEPATMGLLGLGALALSLRRKMRK